MVIIAEAYCVGMWTVMTVMSVECVASKFVAISSCVELWDSCIVASPFMGYAFGLVCSLTTTLLHGGLYVWCAAVVGTVHGIE